MWASLLQDGKSQTIRIGPSMLIARVPRRGRPGFWLWVASRALLGLARSLESPTFLTSYAGPVADGLPVPVGRVAGMGSWRITRYVMRECYPTYPT